MCAYSEEHQSVPGFQARTSSAVSREMGSYRLKAASAFPIHLGEMAPSGIHTERTAECFLP